MRSRFRLWDRVFVYAIALSFMRSRFRLCDRFCIGDAIASVLVMRSLIPQQNPKTKSV
ncbi:MAG: hypothetical protein F6J98_19430 [Moorea sp. SIO4G2]|nr:hypothetical protein [Moorena sp. SIO4G2]